MTLADSLPELLVRHLPGHLARQRWSGAANRPIDTVELVWNDVVRADPPLLIWALARVQFADQGAQDYQVFVGARPADPPPDFLHGKERQVVAVVADPDGGEAVLYDALVDPVLAIEILHLVAPDRVVGVRRPIVLEHSNSSIVFDESVILKIFRKVEPGPNPDVEITRMLSEQGYAHVLEPLAELARDGTDLAVLRPFLVGAVEGWHLARTSVRDLLASRQTPGQAGADFAPDAERIGAMLAQLHLAMAGAWGRERGDAAAWSAEMRAHLDGLGPVHGLDAAGVRLRYDRLAHIADAGTQIHVHGDLHLAQVIEADTGWLILDFEGEPARRRAGRYTVSSPLRDVAGMLRSFHYAAAVGRADWTEGDDELDELVAGWEERNRAAFLAAYFDTDGIAALLPADPADREAVLFAFELDKAVYEVGYELGHRPEQVSVPLAGIERLIPRAHPLSEIAEALAHFHEGRHHRLWELLGAHPLGAARGTRLRVWAPNARAISAVGDWNDWTEGADPLQRIEGSGVWEAIVADAREGHLYKLAVVGADGATVCHADPMAARAEVGGNASEVFASHHAWGDDEWMAARPSVDPSSMRLSAYEVHLGSWRRHPDGRPLRYRELAPLLADHMIELGFTHVELLPVAEHPYEPSWGYQVTGYFAPTSRFGSPDDFRWFVDHLHQRGIGVLVDWVPAHFPKDPWALASFDGTPLYEHTDPRRAEHPDWGTLEFDLTKPEVRSFLIANALFWLEELHVDGLRVDAVASMLYLDYSRGAGEWTPNAEGGNEDLDAVAFLQELNTAVPREAPGALVIAEESTAWEGVSQPVGRGGLGFSHKWNMGWMHDTLGYWSTPASERRWHHDQLTFGLTYAWAEHFVLPLSHDEVVHLKRPLLLKSATDDPGERFADLRSLLAWMWAHPGKQLLFMGAEMAEEREWSQDRELDWARLDEPLPAGVAAVIAALNAEQVARPALYAGDGDAEGFAWLSADDTEACTFAFERSVPGLPAEVVVVVANLSDRARPHYRVGLAGGMPWDTILSTDHVRFGGATAALAPIVVEPTPWQGRPHSAVLALPARSVTYLAPVHG